MGNENRVQDNIGDSIRDSLFREFEKNPLAVLQLLKEGNNADIKPQAQRTALPPAHEKPIYIMHYSDTPTGHVAAFYDGERLDLYPNRLDIDRNDVIAAISIVFGNDDRKKFRPEANEPENKDDIQCYAVYPSQLGINAGEIKDVMKNIKARKGEYLLYQNNCADQVITMFEKLGVNMSDVRAGEVLGLPANVRNFAKVNGYGVPYDIIPFSEEKDQYKIYERCVVIQDMLNQHKKAMAKISAMELAKNKVQNKTAVRESVRVDNSLMVQATTDMVFNNKNYTKVAAQYKKSNGR